MAEQKTPNKDGETKNPWHTLIQLVTFFLFLNLIPATVWTWVTLLGEAFDR